MGEVFGLKSYVGFRVDSGFGVCWLDFKATRRGDRRQPAAAGWFQLGAAVPPSAELLGQVRPAARQMGVLSRPAGHAC